MSQQATFQTIYEANYGKLCRVAYRIVLGQEEAREVVQDVFVAYWEMRERWQTIESADAFLYKMVYNRALNYKTRSREYKHVELPENGLILQFNSEDLLNVSQIEAIVTKALEVLPEKCRVIFLMSREDELTYREIAARLDLSVKTVEAQMGIALQRFRKAIESSGSIPAGKIFIIFI